VTRTTAAERGTSSRLARAWLLAAAVGLAGAAPAAEPDPRGLGVLQIGGGFGTEGAAALVFGGGLGLLDTGRTRLDLLGRLGIARTGDASSTSPTGPAHATKLGSTSVLLELALAKRHGRGELWVGGGYAWGSANRAYEDSCAGQPDCDRRATAAMDVGSSVTGPTGALGVRFALASQVLLELEGRYQREGTSRVGEGLSGPVGGFSLLCGFVYRGATPAPDPRSRR
jgi:opacity protein-like surface antigen